MSADPSSATNPAHEPSSLEDRALQGDPVAITQLLVGIPSVNPALEEGCAGEADMARKTAEWLEKWGFETTVDEVVRVTQLDVF